jgi:hypothetical protein
MEIEESPEEMRQRVEARETSLAKAEIFKIMADHEAGELLRELRY